MRTLLIVGLLFCSQFVFSQTEEQDTVVQAASLVLSEDRIDFGDIVQGEKVSRMIELKNDEEIPLVISSVLTTCGCSAADWPTTPMMPHTSYDMKVSFDSEGKLGKQNKVITIISNAKEGNRYIKLVVNVLPKN